MSDVQSLLYQTVIAQARYNGVYEGGRWVAFPDDTYPGADSDAFGDDDEAQEFWWGHHDGPDPLTERIGRGETPDEALADMLRRYEDKRLTGLVQRYADGGRFDGGAV